MKFKEFAEWCNDRAADGCWGMKEAMICCSACQDIYSIKPLLFRQRKREQAWNALPDKDLIEEIVRQTNRIIEEKKADNG